MSLLADLLSKIKYQGDRGDVPPGLKRVVSGSIESRAVRSRLMIISGIGLVAVIGGALAVYFMNIYVKPSAVRIPPVPVTSAPPPAPEASSATQTVEPPPLASSAQPAAEIREPEPKVRRPRQARKVVPTPATKALVQDEKQTSPESQPQPETGNRVGRDTYLSNARSFEMGREYRQALDNYKKALALDPENYMIMNNIASLLLRLGDFCEAEKYSKNALAIKKDYVPSLVNLGIASIGQGNQSEGEKYLMRVLSTDPSNGYAALNIGFLHEKRGENEKAYGYFSRLADLGDMQGYLGVARIMERQGRLREAAGVYSNIVSRNGIDPQIKKLAGERLRRLNY